MSVATQNLEPFLSLRPSVSQHEALTAFQAATVSSVYWRAVYGPLQKLALSYLPFRLYRVQYELGSAHHSRWFALDLVYGLLDLFEFPTEPTRDEFIEVHTRNHLAPLLSNERVEDVLHGKVQRIVFQQGFFRMRATRLRVQPSSLLFYVPYWLAFYGNNGRLRCRVMDAVRRRIEGAKATELFEMWLVAA